MTCKKITAALLCLILTAALCFSACSGSGDNADASSSAPASSADSTAPGTIPPPAQPLPSKSLAEHGMDLIALIQDMVTDNVYVSVYMGSAPAVSEEIAKLAEGDYSTPQAIYKITVPNLAAYLDAAIAASGGSAFLSDPLKEYMQGRMILTVSSMVNNVYGSAAIAAASICTAAKTFVSYELTENMIFVYVFENAHPVLITFFQGDDSTVSATAIPLFAELPASASADDVKALFANKGFEIVVEEVEFKK